MLDSVPRIPNLYWAGDSFRPPIKPDNGPGLVPTLNILRGQFALAVPSTERRLTLIRDPLGINRLFLAVHRSGRVSAASYLIDLVKQGVPCEGVYSVPGGHILDIDLRDRTVGLTRYFSARIDETRGWWALTEAAHTIRHQLHVWFARLAKEFKSRKIFLCLSGGLDSGLIAAFARLHFDSLTAYTYSYMDDREELSEDAVCARRLAEFLNIPFRLVPASGADIMDAVDAALVYGQDWRDFNVHCAMVNELLARAMAEDLAHAGEGTAALVLTGDLMNEFLADYTTVVYQGREYYSLPRIGRGALRQALIRGLDSGDREVGIFAHHGLDVIQPYGLLADLLLQVPTRLVSEEDSKPKLARAIAGDFLPDWIFSRSKVRAQIGMAQRVTGILPTLLERGRDAEWLRQTFREVFGITSSAFLNTFLRAGVYRSLHEFPTKIAKNGYLTS